MPFHAYTQVAPGRYQERFGLDFEEFSVGQRFKHRPGVMVTQQDNIDESLDTMNYAMIHYDARYAAETPFKNPLLVSSITLQRIFGMSSRTFGRKKAIPSIAEIAMTSPVFGGDTLYAESEIMGLRDGDDADYGQVAVVSRGYGADGREVARLGYDIQIYREGLHPDETGIARAPVAEEDRFRLYRTEPDGGLLEQYGLYFEDCEPGETFLHHPHRTVYPDFAVEHALRSGEHNPQYHDEQWMARFQAGRHRVQESLVITVSTAMTTRTFGRVVANLAWTDIKFPSPVFAGDTLRAESTIVAKRESKSRPSEGILTADTRAFNQHGETVISYRRNLLVYKRDAQTPYARAGY